jgi:hypothetical protein
VERVKSVGSLQSIVVNLIQCGDRRNEKLVQNLHG